MSDVAQTRPIERQFRHRQVSRSITAVATSTSIYAAFALSLAFSFALVFGLMH